MIDKNDLKDWLDESSRNKHFQKIKDFVNREIRKHALEGEKTFYISTGRACNIKHTHEKTPFYNIWHCEGLSRDNARIVQNRIIEGYKKSGFDIEKVFIDCGWHSNYEGIQFKNIHNAIEGD